MKTLFDKVIQALKADLTIYRPTNGKFNKMRSGLHADNIWRDDFGDTYSSKAIADLVANNVVYTERGDWHEEIKLG